MNMTKQEKLAKAFRTGQQLTTKQMIAQFGFASAQSARKAVSNLRLNDGYAIYANETDTGTTKYRLGTPTRKVVAAGYKALNQIAA